MQELSLVDCRRELGMTQQELAEKLGCSRNYIAMVEGGIKPFSKKLRGKLSLVVPKSFNQVGEGAEDSGKARREVEAIKRLLGIERDEEVIPKICELVQWKLKEQDRIIKLQRDEIKASKGRRAEA